MKTKKCSKCNKIKSVKIFSKNGNDSWCKECHNEYSRIWSKSNPKKVKGYTKKRYKNNVEKIKKYSNNYRKNHPEIMKESNRRCQKKRHLNPIFHLSSIISCSIRYSLKKGKKNGLHWETLVDFTLQDLIIHLEKKFKSRMSWNNQGDWHIDRIKPISSFNFKSYDDEEFKRCWALCNLQPLWARENQSKGGNNRI